MTTLRELFWVLALGVIGCFAFFFALGAIGWDDAVWVTAAVVVLCVLWALHAALGARRAAGAHDTRLTHARERRGF